MRTRQLGLGVLLLLALTSAALATTSTDTDFAGAIGKLQDWTNGTMGGVLKLSAMLVGMGVAVRTGKLYVPLGVAIAVYFSAGIVDGVFGATV